MLKVIKSIFFKIQRVVSVDPGFYHRIILVHNSANPLTSILYSFCPPKKPSNH